MSVVLTTVDISEDVTEVSITETGKVEVAINEEVTTIEINNLAINYVYSNPNIDRILLGVDNINHLKNNINCINDSKYKFYFKDIDSINVDEDDLLNPSNW